MNTKEYIDKDILDKFEFYNYGHALEILFDAFPVEWNELQNQKGMYWGIWLIWQVR